MLSLILFIQGQDLVCEWHSELSASCEIVNWHESTVLWTSTQLELAWETWVNRRSHTTTQWNVCTCAFLNGTNPCGCTPACLLNLALFKSVLHTHTHTHYLLTIKYVTKDSRAFLYTHKHTHSRTPFIMAASSIFSVFLIIWSVGHRPCRFHGSLLLIKINSIQLHRSWGLLLHN